MYNDSDISDLKRQIKATLLKTIGILALFIIVSVCIAVYVDAAWTNPIGLVVLIIGLCISIFLWGIYGTPAVLYYRFIKEILTGQSRYKKVKIESISGQPVYKDNKLLYYEVLVKESDEDEVEQMLLMDVNKDFSDIKVHNWYNIETYQNYIKAIKPIEE